MFALVAVAGCVSPAPSTSPTAPKTISQPLRVESAKGNIDQYEQVSRCLALSDLILRSELGGATIDDTIEPEATLRALEAASSRASELRRLALSPQFHPPSFALAGRERRVTSSIEGYKQAYWSLIALNTDKEGGSDDLVGLMNDDVSFCGDLSGIAA